MFRALPFGNTRLYEKVSLSGNNIMWNVKSNKFAFALDLFVSLPWIMKPRDWHITNRLSALLSILTATVLFMGSIAQFHHHNSHGDIFLTLSLTSDIGLGCHHGFGDCHHDEENGCGDNCSMHIGDSSLSRDDINTPPVFVAETTPDVGIGRPLQPIHIIYFGNNFITPPAPYRQLSGLRAPPALHHRA